MIVMPANATGWPWHSLARETGRIGHLYSPRAQRGTGSTKPNGKIQFAFAAREFALGRFDVLSIPVRGGGIHYEPSVADWFAGKRATVESLLAIRCAPRIGKDGRPLYLARSA